VKLISSLTCAFILLSCIVKAQCILGTSPHSASALPCIVQGVAYSQSYQFIVPDNLTFAGNTFHIDSVHLFQIDFLPTGISYSIDPASGTIQGGHSGCITIYGTTVANSRLYTLDYSTGTYANGGSSPIATQDPAQDSLTVCAGNLGIIDFSKAQNELSVFPNPGNGLFNLSLNATTKVSGVIVITDLFGNTVISQKVEAQGLFTTMIDLTKFAKGLYLVQLRTAEGLVSKNISVQ